MDDSGIRKTTRLAIVQSTVPIGVGFGALSAGILIDAVGPAKTFAYIAIVSAISFIYLIFYLEDIHPNPDENKETVSDKENKYFKFLKFPYKMTADSYYTSFCKPREPFGQYGREMLTLIVLALLTFAFCFLIHPLLDYLFLTLSLRNFTTTLFGIFSLLQVILAVVALLVILPVVYILRGLELFKINTLVSCFGIIALLIFALAKTKLIVFLSLPFFMFHIWSFAGMRVLISDLVTISEIGISKI